MSAPLRAIIINKIYCGDVLGGVSFLTARASRGEETFYTLIIENNNLSDYLLLIISFFRVAYN